MTDVAISVGAEEAGSGRSINVPIMGFRAKHRVSRCGWDWRKEIEERSLKLLTMSSQ